MAEQARRPSGGEEREETLKEEVLEQQQLVNEREDAPREAGTMPRPSTTTKNALQRDTDPEGDERAE